MINDTTFAVAWVSNVTNQSIKPNDLRIPVIALYPRQFTVDSAVMDANYKPIIVKWTETYYHYAACTAITV